MELRPLLLKSAYILIYVLVASIVYNENGSAPSTYYKI